jgi:hypothetical protein
MSTRRQFLAWLTLVMAVATPVLAQTPAGAPATIAKPTAPIPDFSGVWAHPFLTGFEPPASGPGPVLNTARSPNGVANFRRLIGDHTNPILKPHAAERVKQHGEISRAGGGYPTPSNQCWPGGVPYVFWDFLMQMFQEPDQITMIYRHGDEVRRVHMNQPHPDKVTPSWYGHSVGRYEGDTLVIDTIGVKQGPFAMVDMYGTPFTDKLRVVERYRLVDYDQAKDAIERNAKENFRAGASDFDTNHRGKVLQLHFTVEDEGVFTMPWTATITYFPAIVPWTELICAENRREADGTHDMKVPTAQKPDF